MEFVLIFIFSLVLVRLVRHYAPKIGLIDISNDRSMHASYIPRGGGIGFYLAVIIVLPIFHFDCILSNLWTFLAIFIVFLIGVLDEHHDASPNTKFIVLIYLFLGAMIKRQNRKC